MASPFSQPRLASLLAALAAEPDFVLLETVRCSAEECHSLLFRRPRARLTCRPGDDPASFFRQVDGQLDRGCYLAGFFAYEFGYLLEPALAPLLAKLPAGMVLADLGVYDPPGLFDHRSGRGFEELLAAPQLSDHAPYDIDNLKLSMSRQEYVAALKRIKGAIESGDTYQVNFTLKLLFDFKGSELALYQALRRNQGVSYGGFLKNNERRILTFSPELFFRKKGKRLSVRPMKGTARRGATNAEDEKLRAFLQTDEKNRAENVMIVDLLRNDLGRICRPGGVTTEKLFEVATYESLHQMTSTVSGEFDGDPGAPGVVEKIFRGLFPCGSVTGAPKIRTMQIISELEPAPRGVYTGAIGWIGPDRDMAFNVPIRTLVLSGNRGEMGIGSGVVYDSDPEAEWQECHLKGKFLTDPSPAFYLFETLLWLPGQDIWLQELHLQRLADSAAYFLFPFDRKAALARLSAFARQPGDGKAKRLRLTLDREGNLSLTGVDCDPPATTRLPDPALVSSTPPAGCPLVTLSAAKTDSTSPFFRHKTSCRELYDRERARATAAGFFEVLFTNQRGELTEGTITNLFLLKNGAYRTPPLSSGLLDGTCRQHLLADPARPVRQEVLFPADLEEADAVFLANSVRGVLRVRLG